MQVHFSSFSEAAQALLEIINTALPRKTLFITKRMKDAYSVQKVLDNQTGVRIHEGATLAFDDAY